MGDVLPHLLLPHAAQATGWPPPAAHATLHQSRRLFDVLVRHISELCAVRSDDCLFSASWIDDSVLCPVGCSVDVLIFIPVSLLLFGFVQANDGDCGAGPLQDNQGDADVL